MDEVDKIAQDGSQGPKRKYRKKRFESVISLHSSAGVISKVRLTGPEAEVRYVVTSFTLGMAAEKAGITLETIQVARQHAMGRMSGLIERAT